MAHAVIACGGLLLAWALDVFFGEPRSAWHPVAWVAIPLLAIALNARERDAVRRRTAAAARRCSRSADA